MVKRISCTLLVSMLLFGLSVVVLASTNGSLEFSGVAGYVNANVQEYGDDSALNAEQNVNVWGSMIGGTYDWSTDLHSERSTGLIGNVNAEASDWSALGGPTAMNGSDPEPRAGIRISNYADFSEMTGADRIGAERISATADCGSVEAVVALGRHQGYMITSSPNISAYGFGYSLSHVQYLGSEGTEDTSIIAYHSIEVAGSGEATIVNDMWAHSGVSGQRVSYFSDGGWGLTGYPKVQAMGQGTFEESAFGQNSLEFNGITVQGTVGAITTVDFDGTFNFQDFKVVVE